MGADVLAPCITRPSTAMVLTVYDSDIPFLYSLVVNINSLWHLINNVEYKYIWGFPRKSLQDNIKPLLLNFSEGTKYIFMFYIIPPYWHNTCSSNPSSSKTRTHLFYIINIMGVDVLATQGTRPSATMIFTMLNWTNLVPARQGLKPLVYYQDLFLFKM